ncbi:tubulin polyglutamylase TTLL7-like [Dendronephthya gigantea]|uniref:tubulin polyglutamylase TTLL7-like n=1 Tax=Dendronephthya gigantea TaxID=151771 RepID=UPI00106A4911|nr:tubulin polyglutamylase TTLL7-like [Dendronephthya gigantea]XP_028413057.1 tubulin polyglutamylase TTLL7-like [Dendronephthya gigantea]
MLSHTEKPVKPLFIDTSEDTSYLEHECENIAVNKNFSNANGRQKQMSKDSLSIHTIENDKVCTGFNELDILDSHTGPHVPPASERSEELGKSQISSRPNAKTSQRRKSAKRMHANLSGTKYTVVHEICLSMGFIIVKETDPNCFFIWNDSYVPAERIVELKSYQRINHFPGMGEICRKDALARNMTRMEKAFPGDYNFVPHTWIFPAECTLFTNYCRDLKKRRKTRTFIVKPANGAMGNGIYLVKNADRIRTNDHIVVQEYIDKPMLLDGYKFDLRIYVLVTSCDPLRIFLYDDGLVRLGTECYENPNDDNLSDLFMHLTNYSVNKHNENFSRDDDTSKGSKRSLAFLNQWLRKHDYNVAAVWSNITDIIIKTLIVSQPHVRHSYRLCRPGSDSSNPSVCFEILGFDVLLDQKIKPWLLEVNRSPSFGTDSKLDYDIKSGLIRDAMKLLNIRPSDRKRGIAVAKEQSRRRLMLQPRRSELEISEDAARKMTLEKRIVQLKEQLFRIRTDAAKEDYEFRNSGHYRRIYPPRDKEKLQSYLNLLDGALKLFSTGKTSTVNQKKSYSPFSTLKEEDILDLLEQCEADELAFLENDQPSMKGPKPLSSMPCAKPSDVNYDSADDEEEDYNNFSQSHLRPNMNNLRDDSKQSKPLRPATACHFQKRPSSATSSSTSLRRSRISRSSINLSRCRPGSQNAEKDEELTRRTLMLLGEMNIKFPGKTEEEAVLIINHINENWKYHKERVANYWLVKLDFSKRRKVIDIVKGNVRSILQRVWGVSDLDKLKLSRLFTKIFNRMLWSHGQGLWNCFSVFPDSWETMFIKSTDTLAPLEMSCCRRVVSLCKECLLVVYVFAAT